jgi:hypothetical protein
MTVSDSVAWRRVVTAARLSPSARQMCHSAIVDLSVRQLNGTDPNTVTAGSRCERADR